MQVFEWFSKFKYEGTSDKGTKRVGHLESKRDVNMDGEKKLGLKNRRITICEASNTLEISLGSIQGKNCQKSVIWQNSCSTMKMHLFTLLWLCVNFWLPPPPKKSFHTLPTHKI
jgi:hypothetical protein